MLMFNCLVGLCQYIDKPIYMCTGFLQYDMVRLSVSRRIDTKGSNSNLKLVIVIWEYCCFYSFRHFTPVLEVSFCNFLTFLLMFCFLNDESLNCIKEF